MVYMCVYESGKPVSPQIADRVFHADGLAQVSRKLQQERSLGCARDDDTRGRDSLTLLLRE